MNIQQGSSVPTPTTTSVAIVTDTGPALIPSEFFANNFQFSDGSKNIYDATNHFIEIFNQRSVRNQTEAESQATTALIGKELFSLCQKDLELAKSLLNLAVVEQPKMKLAMDRIWDETINLARDEEGFVWDLDIVEQAQAQVNIPMASPIVPPTLRLDSTIDPTLLEVMKNSLIKDDGASFILAMDQLKTKPAEEVLRALKYAENSLILANRQQEIVHSSFDLRTACCANSRGRITTAEAYTYSLDPTLYSDRSRLSIYLRNERNFVPERQRDHYKVLVGSTVEMMNMSRRYNDTTPTIYAVRGNTASGKTRACKSDDQFRKGLYAGEAVGALNPDTVKTDLRRNLEGITDEQVHMEGSSIASKLTQELKQKAIKSSLVLDERLAEKKKISELITVSIEKSGDFKLLDLDAPLLVSCCRVLRRNLRLEPCVPFGPISTGYMAIREHRAEIVEEVKSNASIKAYKLVVSTPDGSAGVAAEKKGGVFTIVNQDLYNVAVVKPTKQEVEAIGNRVIDDNLIAEMKRFSSNESWNHLNAFKGKTIKGAVEERAFEEPKF